MNHAAILPHDPEWVGLTSYPTFDHVTPTPPDLGKTPSVRIFALAFRLMIKPQITRAIIARMIAPTTANPAMTPPLNAGSFDVVDVTPVA